MKTTVIREENYFSHSLSEQDLVITVYEGDNVEVPRCPTEHVQITVGKEKFSTELQNITLLFVKREAQT